MSGPLLLLAWLAPLALLPFALRRGAWTGAAAALPALGAALWVPPGTLLEIPWLLLGMRLGLDGTGRVFLLFTALLWLAAALYPAAGDSRSGRFRVFFLLAMSGNLLLVLAQDMLSFFAGFALMGLSAYGLVAHRRGLGVRRAGRVYLAWTLVGEVALFSGLALLAARAGGITFEALWGVEPPHSALALILLGLGIKLAMPGLHVWLPLAYPAAPVAGAVVLSGAMIKAGVLGLMRFLPPGPATTAAWGEVLVLVGLAGAFYGVLAGLVQRRARVVLAYSSLSQMGVMTAGLGLAMAVPESAPGLSVALTLYAVHHALVKGALFMGTGLAERLGRRPWLMAGLGLLALAMAGAPLTGGALAKDALKDAVPEAWGWTGPWLLASSVATTLLMARFMALVWIPERRRAAPPRLATGAWGGLVAASALWPLVAGGAASTGGATLGAGLLAAALVLPILKRRRISDRARVPPGDLPLLAWRLVARLAGRRSGAPPETPRRRHPGIPARLSPAGLPPGTLGDWPLVGAFWLALAALLLLLGLW